tara:strand:- start:2043 stop:2318 length:276 start_codon:yes stop_codon:yes gene_type:complete
MENKEFDKNKTFTLNLQKPDQYDNDYVGEIWFGEKRFWINARTKQGPYGQFISGRIGKEKVAKPGAPAAPKPIAPAPAPAKIPDFDDEMPF